MHSSCIPNIRESEERGPGRLFDFMKEWLLLPPLSQLIFFFSEACARLSFMLLHRHRAIIWYAFGVSWLNSRGWGCSKDYALCESVDLLRFCTGAYLLLSKLSVSLKLRGVCV